jgi:preprotein translocase subunit SecA
MTTPIEKTNWNHVYDHLHSSISHKNVPIREPHFYKKYISIDTTSITTQNLFALKHPQLSSGAKYVRQNPSFLSIFSETEQIHILQCMEYLFKQVPCLNVQELIVLWCKRLKESIGDFPFHLLISPVSVPPKTFLSWILSFFSPILKVENPPDTCIGVMQKLIETSDHIRFTLPLLEKYHVNQMTLKELSQELDLLKKRIDRKRFPEKDLSEVFREFSQVAFPLSKETLSCIFDQYQSMQELGRNIKSGGLKKWIHMVEEIRKRYATKSHTAEDLLLLLSIAREAMGFKQGMYPYHTQILTVLGLLSHSAECKGSIAQVHTGEGKSTISTLLAFIHVCQGKTVDIVSSSRHLAQRDAQKYASFFREFNITTSHICTDDPSDSHFCGQIIYGTNYDFEFAFMRDQLRSKPKRLSKQGGQVIPRPFQVVIVDEVDNLFIDSALNSARIAIPTIQTTTWMYNPILAFVKTHKNRIEEMQSPFLQTKVVRDLRKELSYFQKGFYLKEVEAFTNKQLVQWMTTAYQALYLLKEKQDYIIQYPDQEIPHELQPPKKVTIVDWNNTGRLQKESRWQGGLHQFLEAKHGLQIQEEALTVASLCHPIYFHFYQNIYGLTGTMGEKMERNEVEKTYSMTSFDVPPHRKNLRKELPTLIALTQEEYEYLILKEIEEIQQQERPVLLLCETIQASLDLSRYFQKKGLSFQILNELQIEKEDFIIARAGEPKTVTIATNTAGRGTDIILPSSSKEKGGLHVVITFFPQNDRIGNQGFGRCARQGQAGSCRFILQTKKPLPLLFLERAQGIEQTSLKRIESTKIEQRHYPFLALFWKKLQKFYRIPSELFTTENVNPWLEKARLENKIRFSELNSIETRMKTTQDIPMQSQESLQEFLGHLAQQYWAHFFYNRLHDLDDPIDIENLYLSCSSVWEGIFQIIDLNTEIQSTY